MENFKSIYVKWLMEKNLYYHILWETIISELHSYLQCYASFFLFTDVYDLRES